jgi:hypothetical protein
MILARSLHIASSPNEALVALQYRIRSILRADLDAALGDSYDNALAESIIGLYRTGGHSASTANRGPASTCGLSRLPPA